MVPTILIIDDDAQVRRGISRFLRARFQGLEIREACNGREALDLLKEFTPALIICDMEMPVMDGPGFLRARQGAQTAIPLVLHSGHRDLPQIANDFGVPYAAKGLDLSKLLTFVEETLSP